MQNSELRIMQMEQAWHFALIPGVTQIWHCVLNPGLTYFFFGLCVCFKRLSQEFATASHIYHVNRRLNWFTQFPPHNNHNHTHPQIQ